MDGWWLLLLVLTPAFAAAAAILEDAVLLWALGPRSAAGDDGRLTHPAGVPLARWVGLAKWLLVATSLVVGAVAIVRLIQAGPGSA